MNLKHIVLASALAFGTIGQAVAATLVLPAGQERTFDTEFVTTGPFKDVYDFAFGFPAPGEFQAAIAELTFRNAKNIDFAPGAVKVYDGNNLMLASLDPVNVGNTSFFAIDGPLTVSTQTFRVEISGNVVGTGQILNGVSTKGSYDFSIQAAPVPEPETYAMMLAGLGAIGFMLRRRAAK